MLAYLSKLLLQTLHLLSKNPPLLSESDLTNSFQDSRARLLLFDWDGTLTPIVQHPEAAVPTPAVKEALERRTS